MVRYADDFLALFESEADARHFAELLPGRVAKFWLDLVPFAAKFWRPGKGATGTFDFLGFSHYLGTSRKGGTMVVVRRPARNTARLRGFYECFGLRLSDPVRERVRTQVLRYWYQALNRRSQQSRATWEWLNQRAQFSLPAPRVLHPEV